MVLPPIFTIPLLAGAVGCPVSRRSGGRLATTLVVNISNIIFFPLPFFPPLAPLGWYLYFRLSLCPPHRNKHKEGNKLTRNKLFCFKNISSPSFLDYSKDNIFLKTSKDICVKFLSAGCNNNVDVKLSLLQLRRNFLAHLYLLKRKHL